MEKTTRIIIEELQSQINTLKNRIEEVNRRVDEHNH